MAQSFASQRDTEEKKITFSKLSKSCYAFTAEGDPNSGVVIGNKSILVIDAQATPRLADKVIEHIRKISNLPIKYILLTHYHAVRVLGASRYKNASIIASQNTNNLIQERGLQDWKSEFERFPRLFQGHEEIPGLTHPEIIFDGQLQLDLGGVMVHIFHPGKGHTAGDTVAWVPQEDVLFAGDLVEAGATPYCGDAHLTEWPNTLNTLSKLNPKSMVPGRGYALTNSTSCLSAIQNTNDFVAKLYNEAKKNKEKGLNLKEGYNACFNTLKKNYGNWVIFEHCMPFNYSRAFDEANGVQEPIIWTAERDKEMWDKMK